MKTQIGGKNIWVAGILSVIMAAGTEAVVREAGRDSGEVIQPTAIHASEPFTFAVTGTVEGEVVAVKTVSGEVVDRRKVDKLGRVFLAAGLPAGAYLVGARKMVVAPPAATAAQPGPLRIDPIPAINVSEPLHLNGYGFSPNAADMTVNGAPVLAATPGEIVSPANSLQPGMTTLTVNNSTTGETASANPTLAYHLEGQLERRKLMTGEQTVLRLNFEPKNIPVAVRASVLSGPVHFGQSGAETVVTMNNGMAMIPVLSDLGAIGRFELAWAFDRVMEAVKMALADTPRSLLQKKADACAAASALSENSQNKKDLAKEAELDGKAAKDDKNWDKDGKPKSARKFGEFLNAEIGRLEKIARKEGSGAAAGKIAEAIAAGYDAGTAAGLDLKKSK